MKTEWIYVDDRLPEVSGEYLVTVTEEGAEPCTTSDSWVDGGWCVFGSILHRDKYEVIAWAPLPEPAEVKRESQ